MTHLAIASLPRCWTSTEQTAPCRLRCGGGSRPTTRTSTSSSNSASKASAPVLARNLLNLMRDRQPDMMIVSSFLVVSVTMSELVSGVLSLTSWQRFMQKVGTLSRRDVEVELADLAAERTLRARDGWEIQDLGRFRWLVAQLRRVSRRRGDGRAPRRLCDVGARCGGEQGLADAHGRLNREVYPAVLESRVTVKADAAERVFEVDAQKVTWAVVDSGIDRANIAFRAPPGRADARRPAGGHPQLRRPQRGERDPRRRIPPRSWGSSTDATWDVRRPRRRTS